jgi:hypothetical protein
MKSHDEKRGIAVKAAFPGKNLSHTYKGKNLSSCRTRDACTILQKPSSMTFISAMNYRKKMNLTKTNNKFIALDEIKPKTGFTIANLKSSQNYFCTKMTETYFDSFVDNHENPTSLIIHDVRQSLHIVDTIYGSRLMDTLNEPVYILVPRAESIQRIASRVQDHQCLEKLLMESSITKRGKNRSGISQNYLTLGAHARRGGTGISMKEPPPKILKEYNNLKTIINRVETIAKTILPSTILRGLNMAKRNVNSTESMTDTKNCIWPSVAVSSNYISPAHVDEDFFLSCLTITTDENISVPPREKTRKYTLDEVGAQIFCFPTFGIGVMLRPGDILLFNPKHYHCCAMRETFYENKNVVISSFYLKTSIIGRNNNSI